MDAQDAVRSRFPGFYNNPVITDVLAPLPRWTVSDANKVPIDARFLIDTGVPRGARFRDERSLVTLGEMLSNEILVNAANCALSLDATSQGCVVIDVEKTCPPDVRDKILAVGGLYNETSLSGKGYHLLMPLPTSFNLYPYAAGKTVLRHPEGWWEVLQRDHYVTFTRNGPVPGIPTSVDEKAWDDLWCSLARTAKEPVRTHDVDVSAEARPNQPWYPEVLSLLKVLTSNPPYTLERYNYDHSRYEWAIAQWVYDTLLRLQLSPRVLWDDTPVSALVIDETTSAWLIYEALMNIIDHRPKHDETRNGLPLLLSTASRVLAQH